MAKLFGEVNVNVDERSVQLGGSWDNGLDLAQGSALIQLCYDLLPKDQQCIMLDIGANTGSFSLLPAALPLLKVYGFEPNPAAFDLLQANIALNELQDKAYAYRVALSNTVGSAEYKVPKVGASGLGCLGTPQRFHDFNTFSVNTTTLDMFVKQHDIPRIDLIKVDTEGCELYVFEGAKETLEKFHPIILTEYQPLNTAQFNYTPDKIDACLEALGYTGVMVTCEDKLYRRST